MHRSPEAKTEFSSTKTSFVHGVQGVRGFWETSAQVQLRVLSLSSPHARKQNFLENDAHRAHRARFCASSSPYPISFCGFPCGFLLSQRQELCGLLRCLMTVGEAADSRRQGDAPDGPEKGSARPWFGCGGRAEGSSEAEEQAELKDLAAPEDRHAGRHHRHHAEGRGDGPRCSPGRHRAGAAQGRLTG